MSYRDEREALRQQVGDLEQELARTRRELEEAQAVRSKTDRLEVELAATQRTLDRIRGELRGRRPVLGEPRRALTSPRVWVLLGVTAWTAAAVGMMCRPARSGHFRGFEQEGRMPQIMAMAQRMGERRFPDVVRSGSVASVNGDARLPIGSECSVTVVPARLKPGINCKVSVQCDGQTIYGEGESGYALCEVEDGTLVNAVDRDPTDVDSDPSLTLDLAAGRVSVSDIGVSSYAVTIDLAKPGKPTKL